MKGAKKLDFRQYQELAQRTARKDTCLKERLVSAALGLTGEAGEVAELIKKYIGHNHELKKEEVTKELGDVLWYIVEMCSVLEIDIEEVPVNNIEKLKKRYPNGFEKERSIKRGI